MPSGGARKGSGRKPVENKRKKYSFYLNEDEKEKLKEYLKRLRG